jgi:hypothetical protein
MPAIRQLGVFGANNPTKKSLSVQAADFAIGGLIGKFERKFNKAFEVKNPQEVLTIFGPQVSASMYGWDAVNGFFQNAKGVGAKLYISSHVGYTGSAIDAVVASQVCPDTMGSPATILTVSAAYQGDDEYGISGNRTGIQIELGDRFTTASAAIHTATSTKITMDSVSGIRAGDIIKMVCTGGTPGTVFKSVLNVLESTSQIELAAVVGATFPLVSDVITVPGFRIHTFRKSITGLETEVDLDRGRSWLTTEAGVTDFYAPNVFAGSSWLKIAVSTSIATLDKKFPAAISTTSYPTTGADGTAPTTAAHWQKTLDNLDNLPVRMIANVETTTVAVQKAIETYAQGRWDNPKVIWNVAEARTKAQLVTIGNNFQRSDAVLGIVPAQWLLVSDPFNTSANAPYRHVPNGGHIMGLWCRSIGLKGIHYIPCTQDMPLYGVMGISGDQFLDDGDRTDLAQAGVNCIQEITGLGIVLRNMFTGSTATEFMFANGLMMRDYIKVSAVTSLALSENTPNSLNRVKEDKSAILTFLYRLWNVGSTGGTPLGEFFGQQMDDEGNPTKADEHFEVQADLVNNPLSSLALGERNLDVWFTYPAPAGSIRIGVGIMLKS